MNTFPLVRTKWTNEHIMAAVFGVLALYLLPGWVERPAGFLNFLAVVLFSLFVDVTVNFIRYKRPICGVSAAVTSAILYILTPGIALWVQLLGVVAALLLGKHIWGGTGKNPINPAMTGVLLIGLLFKLQTPDFSPQLLLLPALLLSIPLIKFRPYASLGFMAGMAAALVLLQKFGFDSFIGYGAIFWGCLVLTDPVTISPKPLFGAAAGALVGAAAIVLTGSTVVLAAGVLLLNVICYIADTYLESSTLKPSAGKAIDKLIRRNHEPLFYDLSLVGNELTPYEKAASSCDEIAAVGDEASDIDSKDDSDRTILDIIREKEVLGLGGAAFPAADKIKAVMEAAAEKKYLIINGVECDPGLIHDHWLINRNMKEICTGIKHLQSLVDFELTALAVKVGTDIKACEVNVVKVPDYYPVGSERNLIKHVLGKELLVSDLPAQEGILVLNVQTVYAVYEALCKNKKADTRLITVADLKTKTDYIVRVRLGTRLSGTLEKLPLAKGNIFIGGGAMQCRNASEEDVIDKNTNFIAIADFPRYKESVLCSNCGFCTASCPMGLRVNRISALVDKGKPEAARKYEPEKCLQCGNCSRVCLAGKNLSMRVKNAKALVK